MGDSKFWFYPDPSDPGDDLIEVNLRRKVTALEAPSTEWRQAVATSYTGAQTTVQWGGTQRIRVRMTWNGIDTLDRLVRRRLEGMLNHLDRGGYVMFAADATYFYVGAAQFQPTSGQTALICTPMMEDIVAAVDLTGREIVLRSANPDCIVEALDVATHTQGTDRDTFSTSPGAVMFDYADQPYVIVRERGSWPALRLPESERGRAHLTTDDEIHFELDLPLEEHESLIAGLASIAPDPIVVTGGQVSYGGVNNTPGNTGGGFGVTGGPIGGGLGYNFP